MRPQSPETCSMSPQLSNALRTTLQLRSAATKTGANGRAQGQLRPHQGPHSSSQPHPHGRGHEFTVCDSLNLVLCVDGFMDNSLLKPSKGMIN